MPIPNIKPLHLSHEWNRLLIGRGAQGGKAAVTEDCPQHRRSCTERVHARHKVGIAELSLLFRNLKLPKGVSLHTLRYVVSLIML